MSEYIERETVLNVLSFFNDHVNGNKHFLNGIEIAKEIVEDAPSVDIQPVVRCINCKYYEGLACCELIGDCGGTNWFCGWGKPKEET